ncbi:hypothetical protein E3U43_004597 [Larimichthys crocea]|uniref:Uncharacterized protein n=1 Tax=Larimichthys crocea TaxID=215358 RepID=A0ACD3QDM9_LARCR|nr:hypothetical protein E3U43_004597 [Larimichthys crocea]
MKIMCSLNKTRPALCLKRPSPPVTTPCGSYSPTGLSVLSRLILKTGQRKTKILNLGLKSEKSRGAAILMFVLKTHFMFDCIVGVDTVFVDTHISCGLLYV